MLIDNKVTYSTADDLPGYAVKTVVDFIRQYTNPDSGRKGQLDIVTGFFTIAGLALLHRELSPNNHYRLVLSELAGDDDVMIRVINLLHGDLGVEATLRLSQTAQHAIDFLKRETVEVRAMASTFCHAKAYVYRDKTDDAHHYYIMGSSNLTEAGLGLRESANIELNFAETGNTNGEYKRLRQWFQMQWDQAAKAQIALNTPGQTPQMVDVKQYFIERIEACFGRTHTPEEIYYKILFELFQGDLDLEGEVDDVKEMILFQDSTIYRTLFDYQKKGVISLIKMLRKWNGAILADAVGLGKTFSALAVMKYFQNNGYQVLLLCPKKLEQNWKQYRRRQGSRFERDAFDYMVRFHTDLQGDRMNQGDEGTLDYLRQQQKLLVVIDESHHLRNDKSSRYQLLLNQLLAPAAANSVRDVKVLLLSATPINNGLWDIRNQFKLLARGNNAAFHNDDFQVSDLDSLFRAANQTFADWSSQNNRTIGGFIAKLPQNFFNLTDRLIVARTRAMIEKTLGEDLGFPQKLPPKNMYRGLTQFGTYTTIESVYDALLGIHLTAYQPSQYMEEQAQAKKPKDWQDNTFREKFLVKMMAVLFMKRLESCWYSCLTTIEKVLAVHRQTLATVEAFMKDRALVELAITAPDETEFDEDTDSEAFTLRNATIDLRQMARVKAFHEGLKRDVQALQAFRDNLGAFQIALEAGTATDDKLACLMEILADKQAKVNKKVIVFTSYGDTAEYLYEQLCKTHPQWRVACITGQTVQVSVPIAGHRQTTFLRALQHFAPYSKLYKELDWSGYYQQACEQGDLVREEVFDTERNSWCVPYETWRSLALDGNFGDTWQQVLQAEVDILIATDCLSEGQNLQDADLVINYDIHWNPVRIIQRFGRIDRIGSPNSTVQAINFWPANNMDAVLRLANRINNKMAMMNLVGTEMQPTTDELAQILQDDPLIDHNTQKLLKQIAEANIDEIEEAGAAGEGDNLGLQNFSLEVFRQDLLDYFEKHRDRFRQMPAGIFSGFRVEPTLFDEMPESLVAVLGYPRRKPGDVRTPYKRLYLMMQPVGPTPPTWQELSTGAILNFLRQNKAAPTCLPEGIAKGDLDTLQSLSCAIQAWIGARKPKEVYNALESLFNGQTSAKPVEERLEDIFRLESFDLVAWEYVSN